MTKFNEDEQQIIDDDGVGWEVEYRLQDYTMQQNYSEDKDTFKTIKFPTFFKNNLMIRTFDEELQEGNAESKHRRTQSKNTLVRDKKEDALCVRVGNKLHSKVNLPMRGGKISVVCHDHRNEPKLCTCTGGNKSLSNKIV